MTAANAHRRIDEHFKPARWRLHATARAALQRAWLEAPASISSTLTVLGNPHKAANCGGRALWPRRSAAAACHAPNLVPECHITKAALQNPPTPLLLTLSAGLSAATAAAVAAAGGAPAGSGLGSAMAAAAAAAAAAASLPTSADASVVPTAAQAAMHAAAAAAALPPAADAGAVPTAQALPMPPPGPLLTVLPQAAAPAAVVTPASTAVSPSGGDVPVDDAIQSLLGLAEGSSSTEELAALSSGPWPHWQASGTGPADALLRRQLTHQNLMHSRLRFPGGGGGADQGRLIGLALGLKQPQQRRGPACSSALAPALPNQPACTCLPKLTLRTSLPPPHSLCSPAL